MDVTSLLKSVVDEEAVSDLHLTVNCYPVVRYNGKLEVMEDYDHKFTFEELESIARELMNDDQWSDFEEQGELDFSYSVHGFSRFRVNAFRQRGAVSLALRIIPPEIPTIDELGLPDVLKKIALQRRGLVLCTGPTGSGKSTTLAAMINRINENKNVHVLTLEDPIEYLHEHKQSIIQQREVGIDTNNFVNGLRAALRQDPDVILLGEMRDLETISIALEAAETGHLVFATLHTNSAPKTVDRIIDVFPSDQQEQVRIQLASTLMGVISQQLLPRKNDQGRVAALEILLATSAVRNIIREGKSHQLQSQMQTGGQQGMIVMNNYLVELFEKGIISREIALRRSTNPEYIRKRIE